MPDRENGNAQVVIKRRRTRRHRRNQFVRRWLVVACIGIVAASASSVALRYFSPSLFRAKYSVPSVEQPELRQASLDQLLTQPTERPVYPYSVVPGGIEDAKELKWVAEHDPIVGAHYAGFDYARAQEVRLTLDRTVYLSYRIGNHIYWTSHRVALHKGETLITDGRMTARSRCGNRVEEKPQQQASHPEPSPEKFDEPMRAGDGTAMLAPPVPFQSALLNRSEAPGFEPGMPLNSYSPFVPGGFLSLSPPPLPVGLCSPVTTKKGSGNEGGSGNSGKNKKVTPCGSGGTAVVPEPGTWLMIISGLAAIYWKARYKLSRV